MEQDILYGTVSAIVFQNTENGYTVLRLRSQDGELVTVVGSMPMTVVGERLSITGRWISHATYGRQFEAEVLERLMPETSDEILAYLSSGAVKGIGPKTAQRIVTAFAERSLDVLENDPKALAQIEGISLSKARSFSESFKQQVGMRRLIEFLSAHRLPAELAIRLYRAYGEFAVDALCDDPYMLTMPYFGAELAAVDAFALAQGVEADDERRVEAGIIYELTFNQNNGHTFIPKEKLAAATAALLHLEERIVFDGIERLMQEEQLIIEPIASVEACYLPQIREAEQDIAACVLRMSAAAPIKNSKIDRYVEQIQQETAISYADKQLEAIRTAAQRQILIVTGGPGTGKTTTMAGILRLFEKLELKTLLAAPTGRAAKRLSECTGCEASTIHRLLGAQYDSETGSACFYHDEDMPLDADAVVVDETSMVDVLLMQSLIRALPSKCRLILVGDPDQLPSVGPGNLFSDLIRSQIVPTVRLTEIFRQAQESLIVMNAHAVDRGEMPVLNARDKDFFFLKSRSSEDVIQTIQDLCVRRLPRNMGIEPGDIQVLTPTRKGDTGTAELNRCLQQVLDPPSPAKKERAYGGVTFREGDRVMQIRNNYDIVWKKTDGSSAGTGIFNGDIGKIVSIDHQQETVTVEFDDRVADYDFAMLNELELAYAMTVHKSQGSEYRAVILAAWQGSKYLLTRSVLYTALTRARELLIIVGNEEVIAYMVANDRQARRYSGLKLRLQEKL
ncbi:MAG: ATP-dependent RecD-like DNA helicase [Oscillospiraceae bacterium]|nr:ATP-dependent RecD-like DNA helicase [Oscillospiraceae bacterium]